MGGEVRRWLELPVVRQAARIVWVSLRYVLRLHAAWIVVWVLVVCANGRATPRCGSRCSIAARSKEALPWHTPDTFFFYISLYLLILFFTYHLAFARWVKPHGQPLAQRVLKVAVIVVAVPVFLNHTFWTPVISWYGAVSYVDFDPTLARGDAALPRVPSLRVANGTVVPLGPQDVVLVGNGPLGTEQRAFIRRTRPDQIYRFNGMINLLPDEPIGHVFVRKIVDKFNERSPLTPGEYWGLTPPLRRAGLVEWLFLPGVRILRERTMCHRTTHAIDVTLINGSPDDASYYTRMYGLPVRLPQCDGLCKEAPPGATTVGGWTSGFIGLLEVLETQPRARIHLLGMNFGAAPNQQHATHVERRLVELLMEQGRVLLHVSPSGHYHSELTGSALGHLPFPSNIALKDNRIQGMRCGEWNVWWFPEWQWSPQQYAYGWLPLPPYFHQGTEFKGAAADLPNDYDPLNCTQHAELLAKHKIAIAQTASPDGRRRLSQARVPKLPRIRLKRGGLYGGSIQTNASIEMESVEECEQRSRLIRKYAVFRSLAHPAGAGGGDRQAEVRGLHERSGGGGGGGSGGGGSAAHAHAHGASGGGGGGGGGGGAPFVNTSHFDSQGYVIVEDVFPPDFIDALRAKIVKLKGNESTHFKPWFVPTAVDPGVTIPNFMARPAFNFMHDLPSHPAILKVLRSIFGGHRFRYCSHNDIGIDRIVGWHKDVLNDQYKHFQSLPLWQQTPQDGGHFIVKTLLYLQDHTSDDDALILVPGSHRTPSMQTGGHTTLHPKKGSVVVFEQRSTHRGRYWDPARYMKHEPERILVSLGYGRDNVFTHQFEKGTRARQADQCGKLCVRESAEPPKHHNFGGGESGTQSTKVWPLLN